MTLRIWKRLDPNFTTIRRPLSFRVGFLLIGFALAFTTPAVAVVLVDQETVSNQFNSGLRVQTFVPVGQTFVPTVPWHVGVELLLSMSCSGSLPPATYSVFLRERSLAGPVLASGTTPPFECPALSTKEWVEILFDEPVELVPGDTYFLTVTTANIAGFWWRAGLDPYPDGAAFVSGRRESSFDWGFRTLANVVDAFECYDARTVRNSPRRRGPKGRRVHLSDQFEEKVARVGKGGELCVPVDWSGEGIAEQDANLLCYDIKPRKKARGKSRGRGKSRRNRHSQDSGKEPIEVRVSNELGGEPGLIIREPQRLCVPTTIADVGSQHPPGDPASLTLDHFKCYGVEISPNLTRAFPTRLPKSLCTPVDKNGEGIFDAATHLTCYDFDDLHEPTPPELNSRKHVSNQFGENQRYDVTTPKTLCVPSTVEIVVPPPAPCSPIEEGEFGLCRAIIGWGIDAQTGECAPVSGCECDDRCRGRVFNREGACLQRCGGAQEPEDRIVIDDPIFFDLPINSLRYAVSGYDADTDLCVTAIFSIGDASDLSRHCDDFGPQFPYVVIAPGEPAGCWHYGTDVELLSVDGCVDFAAFNFPIIPGKDDGVEHTDEVDLELRVTSDVFSGTVHFDGSESLVCESPLQDECRFE